jgi:hypothetical protein
MEQEQEQVVVEQMVEEAAMDQGETMEPQEDMQVQI